LKIKPLKTLMALLIGFGLLTVAIGIVVFQLSEPDLSKAICQTQDLGEFYHPSGRPALLTEPYLELTESVVAVHTVELVDLQLTYTILECSIIRYADEATAQRAFERVCAGQPEQDSAEIGETACQFAGLAPRNLVFRRNVYLVLMSGDVTDFPAKEVDERLH
jgi:hypothetical protein